MLQKKEAIQKASDNKMSDAVIGKISDFFDEYINAGFVTTINGRAGQTLKVFAYNCIITTKNDSKKSELENMLNQFIKNDDFFSTDDKQKIVKGLMSGRLVQTGIGVAMSASINQQEKERERSKNADRLITVGERRIFLRDLSCVDTFSQPNTANGYLKLVPKDVDSNDFYACDYFFFNNSIPFESKKIKQRIDSIKNYLNDRIATIESEAQMALEREAQVKAEQQAALQAEEMKKMVEKIAQETIPQNKPDVFDEVRKFKQLWDEGIITEDEFATKKKELLGL
jgi:hypothetical protein